MKLLVKRKENNAQTKSNVLSKGLQAGYKRLQGGWAGWMRRCTEHFSHRTWIVLLILFVLSTSTYCVYVAVNAITSRGNNSMTIIRIKKPKHTTETGEAQAGVAGMSEVEYHRIRKFRLYMDSLARDSTGKNLYDSITGHRPGLMDSVRFLEIYYQQKKLK